MPAASPALVVRDLRVDLAPRGAPIGVEISRCHRPALFAPSDFTLFINEMLPHDARHRLVDTGVKIRSLLIFMGGY